MGSQEAQEHLMNAELAASASNGASNTKSCKITPLFAPCSRRELRNTRWGLKCFCGALSCQIFREELFISASQETMRVTLNILKTDWPSNLLQKTILFEEHFSDDAPRMSPFVHKLV